MSKEKAYLKALATYLRKAKKLTDEEVDTIADTLDRISDKLILVKEEKMPELDDFLEVPKSELTNPNKRLRTKPRDHRRYSNPEVGEEVEYIEEGWLFKIRNWVYGHKLLTGILVIIGIYIAFQLTGDATTLSEVTEKLNFLD